jgi:DNA-binding MarR family transcriptional regulator
MVKPHYQPSTYKPRESIGYLIKRSHALMHDYLEPVLTAQGFTFIQYIVLAWVRDGNAINPKDFCTQFRHDSGALTRVIDQLVERNLLERARGVADRRKVELRLTETGGQVVTSLIPVVVAHLNSLLADFSGADLAELNRLLLKLNRSLQIRVDGASVPTAAEGLDMELL